MFENTLPLIIALGGGAGIGLGVKALVDTIIAVRAGVSAREGKRRTDIVQQRDEALAEIAVEHRRAMSAELRADEAVALADWAERNMQIARTNETRAREHASELRLLLMEKAKLRRNELPDWPLMDETVPRSVLTALLNRKD